VVKAMLLQFQPTFLDILPLYIVLLASFPLVLLLLRVHALAALIPSLALYVIVQASELNLPGYPEDREWFFNPFAWQVLFVIGATAAHFRLEEKGELEPPPWLLWLGFGLLVLAATVVMSWRMHESAEWIPALFIRYLWPISKTDLAPIRLLHFLALAFVVASLVPPSSRWLASRWAFPFVLCGRYSLYVFCMGILLSVIGQFLLAEISSRPPMQVAVNLGGGLAMVATAALIAWYKDKLGSGVRAASQAPPSARGVGR
jgi:hypothetical protein